MDMKSKSDIKIIFTDIDCTILNHIGGHFFDMKSIKALKKAQKRGVLLYLCTARPYDSIYQTGLFDILSPDGIVCTNGAVVLDKDLRVIYHHTFPKEYAKQIIDTAIKHNICAEVCTATERYITKEIDDYVRGYLAIYYEMLPEVRKPSYDDISGILVFAPKEYDEVFAKEFPSDIQLLRFTDYGVDIKCERIEKSEGVIKALEYLGISKDNAMAIGDDYGDIPMFEAVKYSICMDNGKDEAKEAALHVTKHINKHGVKHILKKLKVI